MSSRTFMNPLLLIPLLFLPVADVMSAQEDPAILSHDVRGTAFHFEIPDGWRAKQNSTGSVLLQEIRTPAMGDSNQPVIRLLSIPNAGDFTPAALIPALEAEIEQLMTLEGLKITERKEVQREFFGELMTGRLLRLPKADGAVLTYEIYAFQSEGKVNGCAIRLMEPSKTVQQHCFPPQSPSSSNPVSLRSPLFVWGDLRPEVHPK